MTKNLLERNLIARVTLCASLLVLVALAGCDRPPSSTQASIPKSVAAPAPAPAPNATTSGYAAIAGNLADPFLIERNQQPLKKELAQLLAEANVKVVRYQSSPASDPMIRRIAQEAADSGLTMIQSRQALDMMSQDVGFSSFLIGALGLYLGDPATIINGASGVLAKGDARQQEKIKWGAAFNRSRAAQLMLPEAAKAYAGPASPTPLVGVDFDESFAGSANHDFIALTNVSGKPLTNCTVLVELRGKDGDVRQNVHFLARWEPAATRFACYGIGIESDSGVYGRRTVYGVQEIRTSVWADEASQESVVYTYAGTERDKDVRALLDGKMKVLYRYDAAPLFGNGPEVVLSLADVPMIPPHVLTLTLVPKSQSATVKPVSVTWNEKDWKKGEERRRRLGDKVKFAPETMEIKVSFSGIGYAYTREVAIKKN